MADPDTDETPALDDENDGNDGRADTSDLFPEERRAQVVDLKRAGKNFRQIGETMGFTKQRAHQLYWEAMHGVEERAVSAHRAELIEIMNEVIDVANEIMHTQHLAHSNGRVVLHPDTQQPVADSAPRLDAGRTITSAVARLSKLVGADAATKVEGDMSLKYEIVGIDPTELL